jgi:hypothetical protein
VAVWHVHGRSSVIADAPRVHGCLAPTFWEHEILRQKRKSGSHVACSELRTFQLSGIAVPSVVPDSFIEGPETIWRPLERSLGLAGNEYRLAGLLRWRPTVRWWPRSLLRVGYRRSEVFASCHMQRHPKMER